MAAGSRILVLAAAVSFTSAFGQPVKVSVDGATPTLHNDSETINIDLSTVAGRVNIYCDPADAPNTDIGLVLLTGTPASEVALIINSALLVDPTTPFLSAAARDWAGAQMQAGSGDSQHLVRLGARISRNLTGSASVGRVFRVEVGGSVLGAILANADRAGGYEPIEQIIVTGDIGAPVEATGGQANSGDIVRIQAGSIHAGIRAPFGSIHDAPSLGAVLVPTGDSIIARDGILSLIAKSASNVPQDITATIIANYGNTSGALHFLFGNNVSGSIAIYNVADPTHAPGDGIYLKGDLDAPILIAQDSYAPIDVRGSFTNNAFVQVGQDLHHDIIAHGSITEITVNGQVLADINRHLLIKSETGDIGSLVVHGAIGVCGNGCLPGFDVQIGAAGTVGDIKCNGEYSGFSLRNSIDPASGWVSVHRLIAGGNLALDTRCGAFDLIRVAGNLGTTGDGSPDNPIEVVHFLSVPQGHYFQVGGQLAADISVDGVQQFSGQIIGNAACSAAFAWPTEYNVFAHGEVGGYVQLVPHPWYSPTSPNLGGGAVGLINPELDRNGQPVLASHVHAMDCEPPSGSMLCETPMPVRQWPGENFNTETAVLRHYIPVFNSWSGGVYRVYRFPNSFLCQCTQLPCDPCNIPWVDVTSLFRVAVAPVTDASAPWIHEREAWVSPITGVWDRSYNYKIELVDFDDNGPIRTRLRADRTFKERAADAPNIAGYPYYLYFPVCFDLNLTQDLDPGDLMAWSDRPVDFNVDGTIDEQDLAMLLDAVGGSTPP